MVLSSCSASYHLRRARKLDPTAFVTDTITKVDTTIIKIEKVRDRVLFDTLIEFVQLDPITKTEQVIKYKIQHDSIMIDCPESKIITVTKTIAKTVFIKPSWKDRLITGFWLVVGFGVLYIVILLAKKAFAISEAFNDP